MSVLASNISPTTPFLDLQLEAEEQFLELREQFLQGRRAVSD
jgi:hypothetical protein